MRFVLIVSALASLASADLCFNEYEVAGACTAGTDLGARLMDALYQCDYNSYYTKKSGDGAAEDWHDALNRRGLNRQDNCHDVAEIEQDFYTYMSCKYQGDVFLYLIKLTQSPIRRTLSLGEHWLVQPDQHWGA